MYDFYATGRDLAEAKRPFQAHRQGINATGEAPQVKKEIFFKYPALDWHFKDRNPFINYFPLISLIETAISHIPDSQHRLFSRWTRNYTRHKLKRTQPTLQ